MQIQAHKFPQLHALCWNRPKDTILDGPEALAIYERNWRFVDHDALEPEEARLIDILAARYGGGMLLAA